MKKKVTDMTLVELRTRDEVLREQMHTINDRTEHEKRDLNEDEKKEWNEIRTERALIARELEARATDGNREALETRLGVEVVCPATAERRSLGAKFRELINRGCKDLPIEIRASVTATGTQESAAAISVLAEDFIEPLNKGLIYNKLGLRIKTGLTANVKYPIMPSFEASFVNEKETVTDTVINESALQPVPRRIAISVPLTDLANLQTDGKLYNWIINNIAVAVARTINRWMFQTTSVVANVYGAMAYDSSKNPIHNIPFTGAVPTYAELLTMRGKVQGTGAYDDGTYAYVLSGAMAATLEATPRFQNSDTPILVDGKIGGCPVMLSEYIEATGPNTFNASPKHVGFGRWSDAIVGQFGQMTLTIDPYSASKSGVTNIVLNTDWSVDLLRKESFVIGTVKTAS